ncbi:MAG: hypothetical protein U9Q12_03125 [Patescibacteria group bacterium]|nr:hypothetical protein [Patescibacteria group bacterium]
MVFFEADVSVDPNKNVINFVADKFGYSPIRKIYNALDDTGSDMQTTTPKEYFANDVIMRNIEVQKISLNNGETTITSEKYPGVSATIPANGLVNSKGEIVTGEITGEITYLNPDNPEDVKNMPGFGENMVGVDRYGNQVTIESAGMVFFHFKQEGSDEILQPKKGAVITISQPLTDDRENYYQGLIDDPSQVNKDGEFKTVVTIIKTDGTTEKISENSMAATDYWYFNQRTGLWEEWPSQEYIIDLKNRSFILKVERVY